MNNISLIFLVLPMFVLVFFLALFLVTLMYVDDFEMSTIILKNEILGSIFITKKQKIRLVAEKMDRDIRNDLKKMVKKKDSDLAKQLDITDEDAERIKRSAKQILKNKDSMVLSFEDAKILLESADELSFIGSYKRSISIFSDKSAIAKYKKMREQRMKPRDKYMEFESAFEGRTYSEEKKDIIKNLIDDDKMAAC